MKPFKIAAALLFVFCLLHTVGTLREESLGSASDAVFAAMKSVHFTFNGADSTWYGFLLGSGLLVSVFLLMSAFVAWKLDAVSAEAWPQVSSVAWALCAAHAVSTVVSWKYFFAGPGVFGIAITALLAWGAVRKRAAGPSPQPSPLRGERET